MFIDPVITFLSVDPSLSNTAIVWGDIYPDNSMNFYNYKLIHTEKKKGEKVIPDLVYRSTTILRCLKDVLDEIQPDVCFVELPTGSQSSNASIGVGISCCIIAYLKLRCKQVVTVTASSVKLDAVKNKNATKKEIMAYCENKYPNFLFERKKDGSLVEGRMEHVCDAICIAESGLKLVNNEYI